MPGKMPIEELAKRLEQEARDWKVGPVVLEAAARLRELEAENKRLREAVGESCDCLRRDSAIRGLVETMASSW